MDETMQKKTFTVKEVVEPKLDGMAISIEGKGLGPDGSLGHHAIGLIFYDLDRKIILFNPSLLKVMQREQKLLSMKKVTLFGALRSLKANYDTPLGLQKMNGLKKASIVQMVSKGGLLWK